MLRDKFVRETKKVKVRKTGEEGPAYVSSWPHFDQMLFITDTIKHREGVNSDAPHTKYHMYLLECIRL